MTIKKKKKIARIKFITTGEEIIIRPFGLPDIFLHSLTQTKDVNNSEHQTYNAHKTFILFIPYFFYSFHPFTCPFILSTLVARSFIKTYEIIVKKKEKVYPRQFSRENISTVYIQSGLVLCPRSDFLSH